MTTHSTGPGEHEHGPGGGAWFDRWATEYDGERRLLISPFDEFYGAAAEAASLLPGGRVRTAGADRGAIRVLDLGAGTGLLTAVLAERLPGAELTLLDEAPGMLAQARQRLARLADRLHVIEGDLLDAMPDGPFDVIASTATSGSSSTCGGCTTPATPRSSASSSRGGSRWSPAGLDACPRVWTVAL